MAVSATQIDKARDCWRKFWFEWTTPRDERPPRSEAAEEAAAMGNAVHTVAEDYHRAAVAPDLDTPAGKVFAPALPWLPKPKTGTAEGEFTAAISGVDYGGLIDLSCKVGDLPQHKPGTALDMPVILDYKCKNSLDKRFLLLEEGDFLDNPQALLYAAKALIKTGSPFVYLRWVYMRMKGRPKALVSDVVLHREDVLERFGNLVHPHGVRLVQIKKVKPDPLSLPANPATCERYGKKYPCSNIDKCKLTASEKLLWAERTQEEIMDLLDDLIEKYEASPEPEKAPGPVNPPKTEPEPVQAIVAQPDRAAKAPTMIVQATDDQTDPPEAGPSNAALGGAFRTVCEFIVGLLKK